jgi:sulfite reductase beta subunit-like hemoprotein
MSSDGRDWTPPAKPPVTLADSPLEEMSKNERIKAESQGLFFVGAGGERHGFASEVDQLTGGERPTLGNEAKELSKFFGIYKQQERGERGRKSGDYIFMVRIKCPAGGALTPAQWLAIDDAADLFGNGTLRITSRQGIQYHYVYGPKLAPLVRLLNRRYRDQATLGACGDVNRNTMTSPLDGLDPQHDPRGRELAYAIADELAPRSSSYFQIFLSDEEGRTVAPLNSDEPIYGRHYLPRKFKVAIGHPDDNSVDALTNDVALVPISENGRCDGSLFDLWSGGGLGQTHNNRETAPLLARHHGRIRREQAVAAVRAIALLQKEHGDRKERRLARWKYTLRRLGLERVNAELRDTFGIALEAAPPQELARGQLHLGWHDVPGGASYYGISIENGRIGPAARKGVRAAVEQLGCGVRLTPHQDLVLIGVRDREALLRILDGHGVARPEALSQTRRLAMACPAKPTCGLAMTDAENVLPRYLDAIEAAGLGDVPVEIRMTGCPNHCARPPTAEIGIFGYGKNDHVVLVGGSKRGTRLGRVLYARISEERMVDALVGILRAVKERAPAGVEPGDWLWEQDPAHLRSWVGVEDEAD